MRANSKFRAGLILLLGAHLCRGVSAKDETLTLFDANGKPAFKVTFDPKHPKSLIPKALRAQLEGAVAEGLTSDKQSQIALAVTWSVLNSGASRSTVEKAADLPPALSHFSVTKGAGLSGVISVLARTGDAVDGTLWLHSLGALAGGQSPDAKGLLGFPMEMGLLHGGKAIADRVGYPVLNQQVDYRLIADLLLLLQLDKMVDGISFSKDTNPDAFEAEQKVKAKLSVQTMSKFVLVSRQIEGLRKAPGGVVLREELLQALAGALPPATLAKCLEAVRTEMQTSPLEKENASAVSHLISGLEKGEARSLAEALETRLAERKQNGPRVPSGIATRVLLGVITLGQDRTVIPLTVLQSAHGQVSRMASQADETNFTGRAVTLAEAALDAPAAVVNHGATFLYDAARGADMGLHEGLVSRGYETEDQPPRVSFFKAVRTRFEADFENRFPGLGCRTRFESLQ